MQYSKLITSYLLLIFSKAILALTVNLTETSPASGNVLNKDEPIYIRITYNSDLPLRFQAIGLLQGNIIENHGRFNPSPVYPAGEGEAIAWVAYHQTTRIDAIRVKISNEDWQLIEAKDLPFSAQWLQNSTKPENPVPTWALRLNNEQQSTVETPSNNMATMYLSRMIFLMAIGYWILQVYTLRKYQSGWRKAVAIPLYISIPLCIFALFALFAGSNLWPLMILFISPFLFIYLVLVMAIKRFCKSNRQD
ncbi:MAG: hypothetical protein JSS07_00970 [Proteobacteria bacterium]|nr:hypothetical protein [Pseudomonadota bacterium]